MRGFEITYFIKETTPSLFFGIIMPASVYRFSKIPYSPASGGSDASISVGYEFKKNWAVQADVSFGVHRSGYNGHTPPVRPPAGVSIHIYTVDRPREETAVSLGFTLSYIFRFFQPDGLMSDR